MLETGRSPNDLAYFSFYQDLIVLCFSAMRSLISTFSICNAVCILVENLELL